ncbi:ABC transporter permease [Intrasporangium oryzae NRRL B-24470]|uniref:ABC transporter permease n=1 Tax=Intrasporangium oryzae NRRL B-24470 TaxID=1386089 RepID=W9G7T4_9MICO|nr:amino acid ABC transporter permease [Intrasporangium oryzae]EWT02075.1 ABC transporter permease [Intrasporangium oryzae NRRL B-24470]
MSVHLSESTSETRDGGPAAVPGQPGAPVLEAVPVRHPGRWVAGALVGVVTLSVVVSLAKNENLDWPTVWHYLLSDLVLSGLWTTIWLTAAAMAVGLVGGVVVAVMRLSPNPVLRVVSGAFVWVFRGTPVLVQLIFWGFLGAFYPTTTIGIPFTDVVFFEGSTSDLVPATVAALLALGLNEMAYASEIIRAGIQSVDAGQTEAAHSLGMTPGRTMRRIVLPQAMRVIIPPMGNETITMLKTTALVSVISGHDLMSNIQAAYAQNFKVIPLLVVASIWYLALTTLLSVPQSWLEARYGRGVAGARQGAFARLVASRQPKEPIA